MTSTTDSRATHAYRGSGGFLDGVRVLDFTEGIAGPWCTRLLAAWGANVVKVERPGVGDAARQWGPFAHDAPGIERSLLFLYLNGNKRSITLDLKEAANQPFVADLVRWADIVVESFAPATAERLGITYAALTDVDPTTVLVSVSSFGHLGPYRDFQATEIVEYALSGLMYHIGDYDREPIMHGASEAEYFAGINAANGALASLLVREATGQGQHVDVSIAECLTMMLSGNELPTYSYLGGVMRRGPRGTGGFNTITPCADGYVVPGTIGASWEEFASFLGTPELLEPPFLDPTSRMRHAAEMNEIVSRVVRPGNRFDLMNGAQARGLAWGAVQSPADLVACPHLAARRFYVEVEHPVAGKLTQPGVPFRPTISTPEPQRPAPLLGQHGDEIRAEILRSTDAAHREPAPGAAPENAQPSANAVLADLRVIDAATQWAMPLATALLGDMGAEVIKVETPTRLDVRAGGPMLNNDPTEDYFNRCGSYNSVNRGKRDLTLDLKSAEGKQLFKDLVAKSDVLVDNNRPGVMKRLGLDYEVLSTINPSLIMLSNVGYGHTGPWSGYGAVAQSLEPTTGLSYLTGYPGGPPVRWNWFTDFPTAMTAVFAVLGAIRHRRLTGEGQWIDLSMYEVGVSLLGEKLLDYTVNGRMPERSGNRHPVFAPQGCYACAGDDRWLAISVRTDAEWRALCTAMDRPDLAQDNRFADAAGRRQHHDLLDEMIGTWTASRDARSMMMQLQSVGVPAGVVHNVQDLFQDPELHARGFWQWVGSAETSAVGRQPYSTAGWRMSRTPMRIAAHAPALGEHNEEILTELLSRTPDEIRRLEQLGVTANRPPGPGRVPGTLSAMEQIASGRWQTSDPDFAQRIEPMRESTSQ